MQGILGFALPVCIVCTVKYCLDKALEDRPDRPQNPTTKAEDEADGLRIICGACSIFCAVAFVFSWWVYGQSLMFDSVRWLSCPLSHAPCDRYLMVGFVVFGRTRTVERRCGSWCTSCLSSPFASRAAFAVAPVSSPSFFTSTGRGVLLKSRRPRPIWLEPQPPRTQLTRAHPLSSRVPVDAQLAKLFLRMSDCQL